MRRARFSFRRGEREVPAAGRAAARDAVPVRVVFVILVYLESAHRDKRPIVAVLVLVGAQESASALLDASSIVWSPSVLWISEVFVHVK